MDLTPYLDAVAEDLDRATALADEHTRDIAHRLAAAIEPGLRLALVRAVSDTAARVNTELDEAVVTVTMAGREPLVTVTPTGGAANDATTPALDGHSPEEAADRSAGPAGTSRDGDAEADLGTVRITLRLPEQLKGRAEDLADRAGQSLNTWLVQTVRRATQPPERTATTTTTGTRRVTGWA